MTRSKHFYFYFFVNLILKDFYSDRLMIMTSLPQITSRNASKTYMAMVDKSYLGSSDEVSYYRSGNSAYAILSGF